MPHIHLIISLILVNILHLDSYSNLLFIFGCIFPDVDFILGMLQKKNHRTYFPHYPLVWIFFSGLALLVKSNFYWFFLGGIIHLISDLIDWEVFIFAPFSCYSVSLLKLDPVEILNGERPVDFIKKYYQKQHIMIIEVLIFLFGIATFIWS
ncbi:MAG: zinc dependent phospholipase C family protein [Candidatus Hodarchaeales archaeon]|jgi:hypothetical protein